MFVVDNNSKMITITKGDTGSVDVTVTGQTFTEDDRAIWTVKNGNGAIIFERYYEIINGGFVIVFTNADTNHLPAGSYKWDLRFVVDPVWDEDERIVDGTVVATPGGAYTLKLNDPVGEV